MMEMNAIIKAIAPSATHNSGALSNVLKYTLPATSNDLLQHLTNELEKMPGTKVHHFLNHA